MYVCRVHLSICFLAQFHQIILHLFLSILSTENKAALRIFRYACTLAHVSITVKLIVYLMNHRVNKSRLSAAMR